MCSQVMHLLGSNLRKGASCRMSPGQGVPSVFISVFFDTMQEAGGERQDGSWEVSLLGFFGWFVWVCFNFMKFVLLGKVCNSHIVYHIRVSKYIMA